MADVQPGVYRALWYPPDGSDPVDLNPPDEDWWSLRAISGLGAPPVELVTRDNPDGGVVVEWTRPRERTILWPIRIKSTTHLGFLTAWRHVVDKITQTDDLGPGRLLIQRPDGTEREILACYSSGLEGEPGDGAWLTTTEVVNLLCPDPYWRDTNEIVEEFADEPSPDYLDPYPSIASGRVIGAATLTNAGAREAWPTWRIRGPMTSLTASNNTRGEVFTLTHTLAAGEIATITSRPLQVRGPAGENLIAALNLVGGGGKPWRLDARTTTDVTFAVTGSAPDTVINPEGTRLWLSYPTYHKTA